MPIKISGFRGMSNIEGVGPAFVGKEVVRPHIVLNADVTDSGRIVKREGFTKHADLTDGHSLWSGTTCVLVMDGTVLKRLDGEVLTDIVDVGGIVTPMFYEEVADQVYISNKYFNGIFDPGTNEVAAWGISLPGSPILSPLVDGAMDPGIYHVCFTTQEGNDISGNGPISAVELDEGHKGIAVGGRPAGGLVWCTDPDGDQFYFVGAVDEITTTISVEPLLSLFCSPPPYLENITHAFGRMWGSRDNILYYSEPFHLDWWKLATNYFEFATNITLIAKVKTGLFIGCEDRTYCLLGTQPEEMKQLDAGAGAIPGTLTYCNDIIELGDTISPPEKKHSSVPVWVSKEGIVAGNPVGRLFSLSQDKVKFNPGTYGASLYRMKDGAFQFMTSFRSGGRQDGIGMSDEATVEVMRNGSLI